MHGSSHDDIVVYGVPSLVLHAFIRVKQRVVGWVIVSCYSSYYMHCFVVAIDPYIIDVLVCTT